MALKQNKNDCSSRNEDFARAIRQNQVKPLVQMVFAGNPPSLKSGFCTETELWDYKADCPKLGKPGAGAWAEIARHVLAFYNNNGGVIFFGVHNDTYSFLGARPIYDSKLVNDQLRKYLGDKIWVEFHREFIQDDQRYLGVALIPPRGPRIGRFLSDGIDPQGNKIFSKGEAAIRRGDSSHLLSVAEVAEFERKLLVPPIGQAYIVDEPCYRILQPEYVQFVDRPESCRAVEEALSDPRTSVTALLGIGGVGKTALATWAVIKAYEQRRFEFITSITAKDRELTAGGIRAIEPALTSFESLLDNILDVLGFPEIKTNAVNEKEAQVRELLKSVRGLLFVDNLETVDDARIIKFLDTLPVGTRAIVTSRRSAVRVSVYPIDVGTLNDGEIVDFIESLSAQSGFGYLADLSVPERLQIGKSCDGIPLAIRWILSRAKSAAEAFALARNVDKHGEELLEFSFRRVFDKMTDFEKKILHVLALFDTPMPMDVLLKGSGLQRPQVLDSIEGLVGDVLIQRYFDPNWNDYVYSLMPVARTFVAKELTKVPRLEETMRKTLTNWFGALDIHDLDERRIVSGIRRGKRTEESVLVDLALGAERRNDINTARDLYEKALSQNPSSWRALKVYGKFLIKKLGNWTEGLRRYEQAASFSPARGIERAMIFREWGVALRDSGSPRAMELAVEKFETALTETPNDVNLIFLLSESYAKQGMYSPLIQILEPILVRQKNLDIRKRALAILLDAYKHTNNIMKVAETQQVLDSISEEIKE